MSGQIMKREKLFDRPLVDHVITFILSLGAATLFFYLGGSVASVYSDSAAAGLGFKAGGAIAGFLIILWLSNRMIRDSRAKTESSFPIRFYVTGRPQFTQDSNYRALATIYD